MQGLAQIVNNNFKTVKDNLNLKQTLTTGMVSLYISEEFHFKHSRGNSDLFTKWGEKIFDYFGPTARFDFIVYTTTPGETPWWIDLLVNSSGNILKRIAEQSRDGLRKMSRKSRWTLE